MEHRAKELKALGISQVAIYAVSPTFEHDQEISRRVVWPIASLLLLADCSSKRDVMSVPVETQGEFRAGTPVKLFTSPSMLGDEYHRAYDIDGNDKQFMMVRTSLQGSTFLGLVLNGVQRSRS